MVLTNALIVTNIKFFRGRVKNSENSIPVCRWLNNGSFFAFELCIHFSWNTPPNVKDNLIFPLQKNGQNYELWISMYHSYTEIKSFRRWQKIFKIWPKCKFATKSTLGVQDNMVLGVTIAKNTCRRLACENYWKCVHFRRSRCFFPRAMGAQIVRNHRKIEHKCIENLLVCTIV